MTKDSESAFKRTLEQKTIEARKAVDTCLKVYLGPSDRNRQTATNAAFDAVDRVFQILHENDRPDWLTSLRQDLKFSQQHFKDADGVAAVQRVASEHYPRLLAHEWKFVASSDDTGFDFDAVFEKYRVECRISELFDELIRYMKEIVNSEAIDNISVGALRELHTIIATLHSARKGSYFATRGAWYFVATWFKNTGWELLGSIPIAGSVVKGLQKTLEETDGEMLQLHDKIQTELEHKIATDFPRLEYKRPQIPRIEVESGQGRVVEAGE